MRILRFFDIKLFDHRVRFLCHFIAWRDLHYSWRAAGEVIKEWEGF